MYTTKQVAERKVNGAHFTPQQLARFVASRIIDAAPLATMDTIRVLDPACGDGELLLAFAEMLPPQYLEKTCFLGVDSNEQSLAITEQRLKNHAIKHFILQNIDFLELCKGRSVQLGLFDNILYSNILNEPINIIIANPPYVRTQVLGSVKAQELATLFGLKGRVDLYQAFLVAMTFQLAQNGILGVITSNRFLSTRGGASIRELIAHKYDIIELFDLGDTKLFEAAVLPAIFIGRKRGSSIDTFSLSSTQQQLSPNGDHGSLVNKGRFVRIYEEHSKKQNIETSHTKQCDSIYSVLNTGIDGEYLVFGQCFKMSTGFISIPTSSDEPWRMVTSEEATWLRTVDTHTKFRFQDLVKVRVGIKTTADEVFIRTDWDQLSEEIQPEEALLRVLLSQEKAVRWRLKESQPMLRRILYTHTVENGKRVTIDLRQYPKGAAYLERYRERLSSRKYVLEAGRNWYEIWVPQNPSLWAQPKLVFPDISPEPRFYYDDCGYLVDGNCYWITINADQTVDLLFLIAGVANSNFMTRYHDLVFNNKLYAGRRRYLTQYVEKYPLPDPAGSHSQRIIEVVKQLVFSSLSDEEVKQKEHDLEIFVAKAFGVEPLFSV